MSANLVPPAVKTKVEGVATPAEKVKAEKAPKAPKEKKETAQRSSFSTIYPESAPIQVLVEKNPKRVGSKSHARFEGYFKAKTVGEALAAGVTYADIAYDVGRNHIKVG